MSEEGRVEAPERIWIVARTMPVDRYEWVVYEEQETATALAIGRPVTEYARTKPPMADAEMVALELVKSLYNVNCFECSDVFCAHWQSSAASIIYDALSAAEQRGRDERNEFLQQVLRAAAEEEVNLHVSSGLLKAISIIRSNQ